MKNKTVEERMVLANQYKKEALDRIHNYREGKQDGYSEGFSAHKKKTEKVLRDALNKYRSKLSEEQTPKLGRTANYEKEVSYKAYIEILIELQNKLK